MLMVKKRFGLLIVVLLALVAAPTSLWAQSDCDVTLSPGDDVAAAVSEAAANQVICLSAGEYLTNISISESITLRGAGAADTVLTSATGGQSVVHLFRTGDVLEVAVEHLTLRGAFPASGEEDCFRQSNCPDGIQISGDFEVRLLNVHLLDNHDDGIQILGGRLALDGVVSQGNGDSGLIAQGFTDVGASNITMIRSQFSQNLSDGVLVLGPNQLLIEDSEFNGNRENGVSLIGGPGPTVTVRRTNVINNGFDGVQFIDTGDEAVFENLRIEGNGTRAECAEISAACNGITLIGSGRVLISDSQLIGNTAWGIMGNLMQCGAEEDAFEIELTLVRNTFGDNGLGERCLP